LKSDLLLLVEEAYGEFEMNLNYYTVSYEVAVPGHILTCLGEFLVAAENDDLAERFVTHALYQEYPHSIVMRMNIEVL
jgi:hypothetical protein